MPILTLMQTTTPQRNRHKKCVLDFCRNKSLHEGAAIFFVLNQPKGRRAPTPFGTPPLAQTLTRTTTSQSYRRNTCLSVCVLFGLHETLPNKTAQFILKPAKMQIRTGTSSSCSSCSPFYPLDQRRNKHVCIMLIRRDLDLTLIRGTLDVG